MIDYRCMTSSLRVLTWNVWWRFGPWGERQQGLLRSMRDTGADLIGVQECWPEQIADFAAALEYHHVTSAPDPDSEFGFVNAVLSRWPIESTAELALPTLQEPARRSAVMARIRSPFGSIPMFSTHLDWQYDRSLHRQTQLEAICSFVDQHTGADDPFPALLVGDFNAVPDSDEVRRLTGRGAPYVPGLIFSDVWEQIGEGPGFTWSERNPHVEAPAWPNRRLDYITVAWPRNRPAGNPVATGLVGSRTVQGQVPSDHFGVMADLRTG